MIRSIETTRIPSGIIASPEGEPTLVIGESAYPVPTLVETTGRGHVFARRGQIWWCCYGGREVWLNNILGLQYIKKLLARPNVYIQCAELIGLTPAREQKRGVKKEDFDDEHGSNVSQGSSVKVDALVDVEAMKAIKDRLIELEGLKMACGEEHDTNGLKEYEEEEEKLRKYLAGATYSGKTKQFSTDAEKARKAVSADVRRALAVIDREHKVLANHLRNSIRLGYSCAYLPGVDLLWRLG